MLVKTRVDEDRLHCFQSALEGLTGDDFAGWEVYYSRDKYDECLYLHCHKESVDYPHESLAVMHLHYSEEYDTSKSFDDQEPTWFFYINDGNVAGPTPIECLIRYEAYISSIRMPEVFMS